MHLRQTFRREGVPDQAPKLPSRAFFVLEKRATALRANEWRGLRMPVISGFHCAPKLPNFVFSHTFFFIHNLHQKPGDLRQTDAMVRPNSPERVLRHRRK